MKNTSKFQNVVIATIVGWLVLFVLPNLMIIATSFLTRDDANFVKMVFTLDNYSRLLDPLYYDVLLHSLNMALMATLASGVGLSVRVVPGALAAKDTPAAAVPADRPVLDELANPYLWAEDFPQYQRLSERVPAVVGGYRYAGTHYVHAVSGDHRPSLYFAAVYGDAALLQH